MLDIIDAFRDGNYLRLLALPLWVSKQFGKANPTAMSADELVDGLIFCFIKADLSISDINQLKKFHFLMKAYALPYARSSLEYSFVCVWQAATTVLAIKEYEQINTSELKSLPLKLEYDDLKAKLDKISAQINEAINLYLNSIQTDLLALSPYMVFLSYELAFYWQQSLYLKSIEEKLIETLAKCMDISETSIKDRFEKEITGLLQLLKANQVYGVQVPISKEVLDDFLERLGLLVASLVKEDAFDNKRFDLIWKDISKASYFDVIEKNTQKQHQQNDQALLFFGSNPMTLTAKTSNSPLVDIGP